MHVYARVFLDVSGGWRVEGGGWRVEGGGGGTVRAQNTEVGNILMSTAQQEIGNTFKSLALRTVFGSQGEITARARHRV